LTDQPTNRPDSQRSDASAPSGYEPPLFVPPYGSESPSQPPYGQGGYGQNQYGEQGGPGSFSGTQGQYGGAPYNQPPSPYNQPAGPYAQPGSPYAQPGSPYGQSGYYGMPAEPKTLSIASMVCGIASVIMGWILLPQIAAIVTGHMALKREPAGKGMSITGLVLGYLCLLGYGAFWLLAIIGLAIATSTSGVTSTF
jgi:hypothetical protein